ncbi:MAG: Omp28-related outer membrane protein [Ignavibacteriales bacterium]|nr:Omp28-related outer membrane protein [Ignavibacteriales bacterium]
MPATVAIEVDRSFNKTTREFSGTIDFTALTNLNGQYKFNVILLESGMVWAQTGGTSNYVHHHVARAMMNGALGEEIINGDGIKMM